MCILNLCTFLSRTLSSAKQQCEITKFCVVWGPVYTVRTNLCTDKNLHGSSLRLHGTGGTLRIFERLSVQVWDLKKAGQLFDRHGSIFVRTRVNTRTVQRFAQIARLLPGIKYRDWSKLCADPCKHHCNRICTDPCKQEVQEQNSPVQKFVRTRVNAKEDGLFFIYPFRSERLHLHVLRI